MDDEWIYGSSSANVYWTIVEGRPQGMPAFGGRIPEDEVWRIAAYVRSLSGLPKDKQ
jgi:cytochrome c oxidase cbb3-type subunit 3